MDKTYIEFSRNTLYIHLRGKIRNIDIKKLQQKLYYIVDEYDINNIIVNTLEIDMIDKESFYNFLDEYDDIYQGNLKLVGSV